RRAAIPEGPELVQGEMQGERGRVRGEERGLCAKSKAAGEQRIESHEENRDDPAHEPKPHQAVRRRAAQMREPCGFGGTCRHPREPNRSAAILTRHISIAASRRGPETARPASGLFGLITGTASADADRLWPPQLPCP